MVDKEMLKKNIEDVMERIEMVCLRVGRKLDEVSLFGVIKGVDVEIIKFVN